MSAKFVAVAPNAYVNPEEIVLISSRDFVKARNDVRDARADGRLINYVSKSSGGYQAVIYLKDGRVIASPFEINGIYIEREEGL